MWQRWNEERGQSILRAGALLVVLLSSCAPKAVPDFSGLDRRIQQLLARGDSEEALQLARRGLRTASPEHEPRYFWAFALGEAEAVLKKQGALPALELLASFGIPDAADLRDLQARKELDQSKAKYYLAEYSAADILLAHAETLAESVHAGSLRLQIAVWRATVMTQLEDWSGAEAMAREAFRLASGSGEASWKEQALGALGSVQMRQSHFEDALLYFERQIALIPPEDRSSRAKALNNAAVCNYRLGELGTALVLYQEALAINIDTHEVAEQSICLGNIGNIYFDRGDYVTADQFFLQAASLNRGADQNLAKWFSNSARANIEMRKWDSAEQYNNKALEIKRRLKMRGSELYSLRNAALIAQGKGDNGTSEALFSKVIHAESDDPAPALESNAGLAKLYAVTGRPEKAAAQFEAALALVDRSRSRLVKDEYKLSYLDSLMMFHRDYVEFLMSQGRVERALEVAEASRARILCERLRVDSAAPQFTAAQYRQLAKATGSVFVSYWTAPQRSYAWLITGDEIRPFELPSAAALTSLVDAYRALIENLHDPLAVEDAAGRELYAVLVAPIADRVATGGRVILVPDGPLAALNFETLPVGDGVKHYLIEDVTMSVAPALNLLASGVRGRPKRPGVPDSLLLIGNPDIADDRFQKLIYAGEEMDKVARHFPRARITELRGAQAVPSAYRTAAAREFSYVHFTAHAIADREHPLDSAILLSGPPETGKLTASSVMQQSLHAVLVTLSACRTAGARTYAGEGLVGFTWAFLQAGARGVIAGLWDVSDESTPKLMDELYTGITTGNERAEALRAAKLSLIRSGQPYSLPYYWGPFQLYVRDAAR